MKLKAKGLAFLTLTAAPLALLAGLTYAALLSRHDINYYLADRPASFLVAVTIGALLAAVFLAAPRLALRPHGVPVPDHPLRGPARAARTDRKPGRTKGAFRRLAAILLGWQVIGVAPEHGLDRRLTGIAGFLLHRLADRVWVMVPMVALFLALHTFLIAVLSFLLIAVHCILILRLFHERNSQVGAASPQYVSVHRAANGPGFRGTPGLLEDGADGLDGRVRRALLQRLATDGRAGQRAGDRAQGLLRGGPGEQPDAIRKAIEVGADFAEIDVQETSDGVIVLNHDRDLMRVAGVPGRIAR